MSVSESDRRDIYNSLETALGTTPANNLMKLLPYQPADQLVTRADMHAQTALLQGEMAELRAELRGDMAELRSELRGDMAELGTELRGDMASLRTELSGDMAGLRGDFDNKFANLKVSTQRLVMGGVAANMVALIGGMLM